MKWERELSEALRELARTADDVPNNPATERRLMEAFDARVDTLRHAAPHRHAQWTWYLAAAASVVLLAGGWSIARWTGPAAAGQARASSQRALVPPAPVPRSPEMVSAVAASAAAAATRPERAAGSRPTRHAVPTAPAAGTRPGESDEFVALPAAGQLPRFESGMIVRVELPGSSLPAYGFPIMPDGGRTPVTADVLVGQDGQPRAIRLVSMETGPRRRP